MFPIYWRGNIWSLLLSYVCYKLNNLLPSSEGDMKICSTQKIHVAELGN